MSERLLIVVEEDPLRESLERIFLSDGYEVDSVKNAEVALKALDDTFYDLIIADIILPGMSGIELLSKARERDIEQLVIIITGFPSLETAVDALRAGAYDYLVKPIIYEELKRVVRNAFKEKARIIETLIKKKIEETYDFEKIIGDSAEIKAIINEVKKIADSKSNVLLLGETGTGKELFAKAIHYNSSRRDKQFIAINCSAIPENLIESELFGYAKGAFTGATATKRGLFEEADGGTFFLDEIGELSQPLQAKLLRVIDDHEIRPLGGVHSRKVDIRFITATNRDVAALVKEGAFREDLYYRINVVTLRLPPLRERKGDIIALAKHFLVKYAYDIGKNVKFIDENAVKLLKDYSWPGNIREMQNIIERAVLIADKDTIHPEHLPEGIKTAESFMSEALDKALSIEDYTKGFILRHQNNIIEQKLADMLGITRKALWEKRKKWNIPKKQ
ncbi:MAG: sigma-54 dependent transcriptional regulator [Nitrospiraceae bacterium]|nr:sigma-54 dependent transcriptional regulator [Nitrospiraceae bacterium]